MRRLWLVLAALVVAAVAGAAQAQDIGRSVIVVGGGAVVSETNLPLRVTGQLVVSFHGDAAAGCAAYGLCPYSGTIVVEPRDGVLAVATVRRRRGIGQVATLLLGAPENGSITSARVQRSGPAGPLGTCADAQGPLFGAYAGVVSRGGSVTITALARGGSLLQTRCAGPLDGDLAGVSPAATISLARLRGGLVTVDLSGTRTFAGHGFAGTLSSTLVLKLGKPASRQPSTATFPPGISTQRTRVVLERLRAVGFTGNLGVAVTGTTDPVVCGLLDTCGLSGTLTLGQSPSAITAEVIAMGPASRPYRDFLTALGVARGGRSFGISIDVSVTLSGHVEAQISQPGVACSDAGGLSAVSANIGISDPTPDAALTGPWRTRCPGPLLNSPSAFLVASVGPGALAHRQFTVHLGGSRSFTDAGYVLSTHGQESAVLRRGRITSEFMTVPKP